MFTVTLHVRGFGTLSVNTSTPKIPVIDLFAGAGGLSEGFSVCPNRKDPFFHIALSVEKDPAAVRTLRLRAFFRQFSPDTIPETYYRFAYGETVDDDFLKYLAGGDMLTYGIPVRANSEHVYATAIGEQGFSPTELNSRIVSATTGRKYWVLIGGPPCQPFSTAGRTRRRAIPGYDPETDERNFLYKEYLRIIAEHWPAVFVMENVKGIISARLGGEPVLKQVLKDLNDPARIKGEQMTGKTERYRYVIWPLVETEQGPDIWGLYPPEQYVIESERYGIPQRRHRVILLGIRDDLRVIPKPLQPASGNPPTVHEILGGLPILRSGIARTPDSRQQWAEIVAGKTPVGGWCGAELHDVVDSPEQWSAVLRSSVHQAWFAQLDDGGHADVCDRIRRVLANLKVSENDRGSDLVPGGTPPALLGEWYVDERLNGVCNHYTREHMPQDLYRYLFAAAFAAERGRSPKLGDFPPALLPLHQNVSRALKHSNFADRFRVQVSNQPATTVMSHLAKDGHYFIHPDPAQARSMTVREAARLQTFPDNYFFCGNRTEQYTQVGNAVPPLLAKQIAEIVADVLLRAP